MTIETSIRGVNEPLNWVPCPIKPAWILEGSPVARNDHLSSSADGTASTYYWDCTAGRFNWFYTFDETLHILEGSVLLKDPTGLSRRVSEGDVIFFPKGAQAEWTVDKYVKKLAFCRTPLPSSLINIRTVVRRLRRFGRAEVNNGSQGIFSNG